MPVTTTPRILKAEEALEHLRQLRARQPVQYWAFYSSQLGGIVTDPALMVMPFDDHMVHRGHGVFDTAASWTGSMYDVEAHLDRFRRSAGRSRLALPCSREEMREIILRTAAASGKRDGAIRYWLSSGPGSLGLQPGRRRRARLLRDDLRRALLSRAVVHRRAAGDDHDLSDQAAALRDHEERRTTCPTS